MSSWATPPKSSFFYVLDSLPGYSPLVRTPNKLATQLIRYLEESGIRNAEPLFLNMSLLGDFSSEFSSL